uniref:Putative RNA-binding protein 15B n=1 Tax=Aceria tosichella TaxID=561515 RepID=A0A6G1SD65_9ACAR
MNYNNLKRGRSPPQQPPPFVYDDMMRPAPNHREYDNSYRLPPQTYDGPGRHYPGGPAHPMDMQPMHANPHNHIRQALPPPHPFIESPNHNNYAPSFNEHYYDRPSPANSYAAAPMGYRDPHPPHQPNPTYPNQPRSCSPPYKILCITNINQKIGDGPVKDALTSDFSRFGDISVSVCHDSGERLAYIYFRNCEDAREARQFKSRTIFFDRPIEIEPIYEPIRGVGSPADLSPSSPMVPPSGLPVYSPRRRSMSPPNYQRDMNDPIVSRGGPGPPQLPSGGDPPSSPLIYSQHRGPSPADYMGAPTRYSHGGRSPPPPMPPAHYERRNHHGAYNHYRSPHMTPPYASPTHEQYKSAYRSPSNQSPYSVASPSVLPRERAHIPSRSPHREPTYHPAELRGPPGSHPAHHHSSSRSISSSHHAPHSLHARQPYSHSSHRSQPIGQRQYHHNYPPDPPARFMSRDFRRGKFGTDPHPHEHDDSRPSRVLLVNNIDATKTEKDLREAFEPFGTIEEMEIKNVAPEISSALIKFSSMDGAYKAKTANNGRHLGNLRCRIVYGKVTASKRLWIGGLSPSTTVSSMEDECSRYGDIVSMDYTSGRPYCYVEYETANQAQFAAHQLRTTLTPASERKIRIEFVDPDRSEKLAPRHESEAASKSRTTNESAYDLDTSPRSASATSGQKRSVSPLNDLSISKRLCPAQTDIPPVAASTFKQERLAAAAAAAAKARTSSTTSSSSASHQTSDKSDKIRDVNDCSELNNNSDNNQLSNGNLSTSTQTPNIENDHPSHEAPSLDRLSQCSSIRDIVQCCSVSWPGQIALRNFIFPAQIYMCSGKKHIIDRYLSKPGGSNGESSSPLLRITQRWRLHPQPKLEEVKRRMQSGNLGMLVLTARQENSGASRNSTTSNSSGQQSTNGPSSQSTTNKTQQNGHLNKSAASITPQTPGSLERTESDTTEGGQIDGSACAAGAVVNSDEVSLANKGNSATVQDASAQDQTATPVSGSQTQSRPLRNLISYLEQKDAAGVVSLSAVDCPEQASSGSASDSSSKLLYAFPPGEFALNLLRRLATNLAPDSPKDEYLLGVIVGGNVEGGKV